MAKLWQVDSHWTKITRGRQSLQNYPVEQSGEILPSKLQTRLIETLRTSVTFTFYSLSPVYSDPVRIGLKSNKLSQSESVERLMIRKSGGSNSGSNKSRLSLFLWERHLTPTPLWVLVVDVLLKPVSIKPLIACTLWPRINHHQIWISIL